MNKKLKLITITIFVFFICSCAAQKVRHIKEPQRDLTQKEKETTYFGKVEAARAYKNNKNETVIEWYCHRYELLTYIDFEKLRNTTQTVKVRNMGDVHFVNTLRLKDMSMETANKLAKNVENITKYSYMTDTKEVYKGEFAGKKVDFIGGGKGTISSDFEVIEVE